MSEVRILLVDPDRARRSRLDEWLTEQSYSVDFAADRDGLLERLSYAVPDLVLLDGDGGEDDVLRLVQDVKSRYELLPVVIMTSGIDASVVAAGMRKGAADFVSKPVDLTRLGLCIRNAVDMHRLLIKVNQLQSQYQKRGKFQSIVGISPRMQTIYSIIENVGATDVTVFVTGPSGTGKELIARAIHDVSDRAKRRFIAVNCAAIPRDLMESELFGHERGAFTGATSRYRGCCEQAHGGTLFLDEICEMDINLQSKLLRFLQERSLNRLGGKEELKVDVRVLAATNRNPLAEVREGRLREDLYYRLNVVPIEVPCLRERREDIPLLANFFLERLANKYGKYFYDFSPEAMGAMLIHDWPGNVRELENAIERIVVLYTGSQVTEEMLPAAILDGSPQEVAKSSIDSMDLGEDGVILPIKEIEKRAIQRALSICRGNVSQAARRLQIGQATLYRKLKKYDLSSQHLRI